MNVRVVDAATASCKSLAAMALVDHLAEPGGAPDQVAAEDLRPAQHDNATDERGSRRRCPQRSEVLPRQLPEPRRVRPNNRDRSSSRARVICASDRESPSSRASSVASVNNGLATSRSCGLASAPQDVRARTTSAGSPSSRAVAKALLGLFAAFARAGERQEQALSADGPHARSRCVGALWAVAGKRGAQPVQSFLDAPPRQPQRLQRRRQRQRQLDIRRSQAPGESGSQIVHFGFRPARCAVW